MSADPNSNPATIPDGQQVTTAETAKPAPDASRESEPDSADLRLATDISVKLSTQLMTAGLGLVSFAGVLINNYLIYRQPRALFWPLAIATVSFFVGSIFCGGKGVTEARNAGYAGNWHAAAGKKWFNRQACWCVFGLIAFFLFIFLGAQPKTDATPIQISGLQADFEMIQGSMLAAKDESHAQTEGLKRGLEALLKESIEANKKLYQSLQLKQEIEGQQAELNRLSNNNKDLSKSIYDLRSELQNLHENLDRIEQKAASSQQPPALPTGKHR